MTNINNKFAPKIYKRNEHKLQISKIDQDALKIIHRLSNAGYKGYIVGGGVRDLLINKNPKDFDIATDATPKQMKNLFRNCRIIGRRFKLAHIFFKGNKIIEVSTFRDAQQEENSEDGTPTLARDNVYGDERSDAIRRDLTINALFYNPINHSIIDYIGGMSDLQAGLIRIIGDPTIRFQEDPVRMLRAIRHAARTGFTLTPDCVSAIQKKQELIEKCPSMRLYEEVKKDMVSGHFLSTLQLLQEHKLLKFFLPSLGNKGKELWGHNSAFLQAVANADIQFRQDEFNSITALLTVLALFASNPEFSVNEFTEQELDHEQITELVRLAFSNLAVPRKEKENIVNLIKELYTHLTEKKIPSRSRRKQNLSFEKDCLLIYLNLKEPSITVDQLPESKLTRRKKQSNRFRKQENKN